MKQKAMWMSGLGLAIATATTWAVAQEAPSGERREVQRIMIMRDGGDLMRGAPRMGERRMGGGARLLGRLGDELGLTPQQRGKLTEHFATLQPEMKKLREQIREQNRKLREVSPDDPQFAAVSADTSKRVGELSARLVQQGSELRRKVWGELTPEQRTQWKAMRTQIRERREGGADRVRDLIRQRLEGRGDLPPPPAPPPR